MKLIYTSHRMHTWMTMRSCMRFKIIPVCSQNLLQKEYSQNKSKRDQWDHTICLYTLEKQDVVGTRSQKTTTQIV